MSEQEADQALADMEALSRLARSGVVQMNTATRLLLEQTIEWGRLCDRVDRLEREVAELRMRGGQR